MNDKTKMWVSIPLEHELDALLQLKRKSSLVLHEDAAITPKIIDFEYSN